MPIRRCGVGGAPAPLMFGFRDADGKALMVVENG